MKTPATTGNDRGANDLGSLAEPPSSAPLAVALAAPDDFDGWRDAARGFVLAGVEPARIVWNVAGEAGDLFGLAATPLPEATRSVELRVSKSFVDLARAAACHRDPERFALLYTALWRLQDEPGLIGDRADPLMTRIESLAKAVHRDIHKMRAFVRFREICVEAQLPESGKKYVAWFEPEHHIVRANAKFFVDRFANMRWSILTPDLSIHWDGETLTESAGASKADAPADDAIEAVWKSYYKSIFNPARVKLKAMGKEMPRKYWKNMPETALIPALIAGAQSRESGMIETARESRTASGSDRQAAWAALRDEAMRCTRCPLHKCATQTVFGEGPVDARIVFVGEQPGDQEDLAGRPFVGPAGQLFDRALVEAGIDRNATYVTNAVKNFKFVARGTRRIHRSPAAGEIDACRWWLDEERALIMPGVTVALGASAARALFGRATPVGKSRGRALALPDGGEAWVTVHPSYLLRVPDAARAEAYASFMADLTAIAARMT